jgi:hypothetical protein
VGKGLATVATLRTGHAKTCFGICLSAVVSMSLISLMEESGADPTLVTIEATVATGFEPLAVEECKEKISKSLSIVIARGRVFFNIHVHKMNTVSERRFVS